MRSSRRAPVVRRRFATAALFAASVVGAAVRPAHAAPADARAPEDAPPAHKLTKAPKLVQFVEAPYPPSEKSAGRAAAVVLQLAVGATGAVEQATVTQSAGPAFDAAAVEAARRFVFEPAEIDGKPAPIKLTYRYEFVLKAEAPTTAVFSGEVLDVKTKKPLAGVHVTVEGGGAATTDAKGHFRLEGIAPGAHAVTLSREAGAGGDALPELSTSETFEAGHQTGVTYNVEPVDTTKPAADADDLEIVVAHPAVEKQVVSTIVAADEARVVPGTQGDVLKVVENLPGVARPALGSGALVVWGAAPQDTRVYLDDVPIPSLYHQGGYRSVIHSDMVQSVELVPGGWGADYGRGLGGLVTIKMKPLEADGFHGSVGADLLDSSADVRAKLAEGLHVEIAGRKSYLDSVLPAFTSKNIGEYIPIPKYYDGAARLVWTVSTRESVELGGLISGDSVQDTVPSSDPTEIQQQNHDTSFQRVYLRWKKQLADGAEVSIVPSLGFNHDALVDNFGAVPTNLDVNATVASIRASWRKQVATFDAGTITLSTGADAQLTSSRFLRTGSNTLPARTGDPFVFGQAPTDQIAHDDGSSVAASVAPYITADFALWDKLHLTPGMRVEPYVLTVNRTAPAVGTTPPVGNDQESIALEPRLAAQYSPIKLLTVKAAWGLYHQPPAPADLSSVFGNPLLGLERAQHVLASVAVGTPDLVAVEVTAFQTSSNDLAVRSPLASPLLAQALVGTGIGRTRGVQIMVRKQLEKKLFGWVSYTLSRAERANGDGQPWYLYDFDQTHVLTAVLSYELPLGFTVGGRFRYASGYPRTPVTGSYLDARSGVYEPFFGSLNTTRIPAFAQLDIRVGKTFKIKDTSLEVFVDVQNATNKTNAEELVYNADYSQQRTINGLPILPVVGARYSW